MSQKRRGRTTSDAERALWTNTMSAVRPVHRRQNLEPQARTPAGTVWPEELEKDPVRHVVKVCAGHSSSFKANTVATEKVPERVPAPADLPRLEVGQVGGTDRRTAARLRRGRLDIDMRLDLHGLTLEIAHRRLLGFLNAAQVSGARCVLVITGKGKRADGGLGTGVGRLKAAVPRWLNEPAFRALVLSVTDARPKDGGTGALYILMRKAKRNRP